MAVRITLELGEDDDSLDQVLALDVDDLLEVLESVGADPMLWTWRLPNGGTVRLRAWRDDTPET